jgi:hypothetical protein
MMFECHYDIRSEVGLRLSTDRIVAGLNDEKVPPGNYSLQRKVSWAFNEEHSHSGEADFGGLLS